MRSQDMARVSSKDLQMFKILWISCKAALQWSVRCQCSTWLRHGFPCVLTPRPVSLTLHADPPLTLLLLSGLWDEPQLKPSLTPGLYCFTWAEEQSLTSDTQSLHCRLGWAEGKWWLQEQQIMLSASDLRPRSAGCGLLLERGNMLCFSPASLAMRPHQALSLLSFPNYWQGEAEKHLGFPESFATPLFFFWDKTTATMMFSCADDEVLLNHFFQSLLKAKDPATPMWITSSSFPNKQVIFSLTLPNTTEYSRYS